MKELLLNEKSLEGQFETLEEFYATLPEMSRNLKILKENDVILQKHNSLYQRKISGDITLYDLSNKKGNVAPEQRANMTQWKRQLSSLMCTPPFWNDESENDGDSVLEAARRETDVLSFLHDSYNDVVLEVPCENISCEVRSSVSTRHLVEGMFQKKYMDRLDYIKQRYQDGRIRMEHIDAETNTVDVLEKKEFEELLEGLERFEAALTWEDITGDRFFDYKSYQPSSKKKNVFLKGNFADKNIDKFRCGQHSQVRCFGYREEDVFYVLLIERDHRYSDDG